MCVLFDRGGQVTVNGQLKKEKADMKIVPKLLDLVSSLRITLQVVIIIIFSYVALVCVELLSVFVHLFTRSSARAYESICFVCPFSLAFFLQENYPDILHSAKIAPSSWFFTFCFRTISATLDAATASKFEIVSDRELPSKLHTFIDPVLLPTHLGGSSSTYQSSVSIDFMKE